LRYAKGISYSYSSAHLNRTLLRQAAYQPCIRTREWTQLQWEAYDMRIPPTGTPQF